MLYLFDSFAARGSFGPFAHPSSCLAFFSEWQSCGRAFVNAHWHWHPLGHGSKPCTRSELPIPTKISSKMGGALNSLKWVVNSPTPKWDPIGFDNHSHLFFYFLL